MYGTYGYEWFMMALVIGIVVLIIVLVIAFSRGYFHNWEHRGSGTDGQSNMQQSPSNMAQPAPKFDRYCSHCGAGLQSGWTHCPQCGAPIE